MNKLPEGALRKLVEWLEKEPYRMLYNREEIKEKSGVSDRYIGPAKRYIQKKYDAPSPLKWGKWREFWIRYTP